jgi:Tetratricopeptide repeat
MTWPAPHGRLTASQPDVEGVTQGVADEVEGLDTARRSLGELYDQHLITEPAPGRYHLHDLIRQHAQDLAGRLDPDGDRDRATTRLLDYYQYTAARAAALMAGRTDPALAPPDDAIPAAVPDLDGREQALAWARAERANLLACLDHGTRTGQHARVVALTAGLARLLWLDGPWAEAITRHTAAIQAARHLGDRLGQAHALTQLGDVRWLTGDYLAAAQAHEQPRRSTRGGRCTGSAATSRRLRDVTGRPWTWPARSAAPGTRLTRWPAWAGARWPPTVPTRQRTVCARHWKSSGGWGRPRPPRSLPNSKPVTMR